MTLSPARFAPDPTPNLPALGPVGLPERPRVADGREAVRRAGDAVQFGLDAPRALVIEGLTPPLVRMVATLDGTRRVEEVLADAVAAGAGAEVARAVLGSLHTAGVLTGSIPAVPRGRDPEVVVHGGGRLAVALACLLAGSRACRVAVSAPGRVGADDVGTGLAAGDVGRDRADAVAEAVARTAGWTDGRAPRPSRPDLVVLADGPVPDPALLAATPGPHLPVAVRDGLGVVGPLVLPGRTPCLRCDELARTDDDPAWPVIAAQLCLRRPAVAPPLAGATAALAADQVLAVLRGEGPTPPVLGAVLELDPRTGSLRRHVRVRHRSCRCGPAAPTTA